MSKSGVQVQEDTIQLYKTSYTKGWIIAFFLLFRRLEGRTKLCCKEHAFSFLATNLAVLVFEEVIQEVEVHQISSIEFLHCICYQGQERIEKSNVPLSFLPSLMFIPISSIRIYETSGCLTKSKVIRN